MRKKNKLLVLSFCIYCIGFSQPLSNTVFVPNITSVQVYQSGDELSAPIIKLLGNSRLAVEFDYVGEDISDFFYTIISCDKYWNQSPLLQMEYLNTIGVHYFEDMQYSVNTHVNYVHYKTTFPNENLKILKSGNYILKVFREDAMQTLAFQARFVVVEQLVRLETSLSRASAVQYMDTHHELDMTVHTLGFEITNPQEELYVTYLQNGRWDNAIRGIKPSYLSDGNIEYDYEHENLFEAGREFHHFSCKNLNVAHENVQTIRYEDSLFVVYMKPNEIGLYKTYASDNDLNGYFLPAHSDGRNPDTDADYVKVHVTLPYVNTFAADTISMYVCGHFNMWQLTEENKMTYNAAHKQFECTLFLKQGYYDYIIGYTSSNTHGLQTYDIEGSFYQTKNEYDVLLYYYDFSSQHDRIIGFFHIEE
ncbi:MAG: DUF5103 domain-containing protein [Bacteroidales bacterium]|jgi:hypothetical protein|nr:DUF5103 domain-containing protein [Bacteroidales bacterium]